VASKEFGEFDTKLLIDDRYRHSRREGRCRKSEEAVFKEATIRWIRGNK